MCAQSSEGRDCLLSRCLRWNGFGESATVSTVPGERTIPVKAGGQMALGERSPETGAWMMADPAEQLSAAFMIQDMLPDAKYYNDRLRAVINGLL